MAFDTHGWLKDLGFTETEILDLEPKFHPRAQDLEKHQLRQSDYSRFVNEYKAKNDQLAADYKAKNDQLTQEMADWASVQATTAAEQQQKQAALDSLEQEKLRLTQAVTRLAEQAGVDPKTVLTGDPVPPKKEDPKPSAFDPAPVYGAIGGVTEFLLGLMGSMPAMADEHYRLTGERLDTRKSRPGPPRKRPSILFRSGKGSTTSRPNARPRGSRPTTTRSRRPSSAVERRREVKRRSPARKAPGSTPRSSTATRAP